MILDRDDGAPGQGSKGGRSRSAEVVAAGCIFKAKSGFDNTLQVGCNKSEASRMTPGLA